MNKITLHACFAAGSLLLASGSAGAGPLSMDAGLTAARPPLATLVRQGADDRVNRKLKRHGQGLDDGPNDDRRGSSSSSSASSRGRGSDDSASHERNGGDDRGGDNRGGRGGGDDSGGRH